MRDCAILNRRPRKEGIIEAKQVGLEDLARITGKHITTVRHWRTARSGRNLPEPDGKMGQSPWWWTTTIYPWIERTPGIEIKHPM